MAFQYRALNAEGHALKFIFAQACQGLKVSKVVLFLFSFAVVAWEVCFEACF